MFSGSLEQLSLLSPGRERERERERERRTRNISLIFPNEYLRINWVFWAFVDLTIPEPIAVAMGMECADWLNPGHALHSSIWGYICFIENTQTGVREGGLKRRDSHFILLEGGRCWQVCVLQSSHWFTSLFHVIYILSLHEQLFLCIVLFCWEFSSSHKYRSYL